MSELTKAMRPGLIGVSLWLWAASAVAALPFILWDSARIVDPLHPEEPIYIQLAFATQPMTAGQSITAFVPLGKSYRVMCCLRVKTGERLDMVSLQHRHAYDAAFTKRVRSIKGAPFVYEVEYLPVDQQNKYMKALAEQSDGPYYSAVGLLGQLQLDRIKGSSFELTGYGRVSIQTSAAGSQNWRHSLVSESGTVVIEEPVLPD